jgi:site-specific DNA-methyltransferase (adenine-specific)
MLGDCLERMGEIQDGSIDLILADLPYGSTKCKWDVIIPFAPLWKHYWRVLKCTGAVLLFGTEPFSTEMRQSALGYFRYDLVWHKNLPTGFLNAKRMPLRAHETISVFYRKLPTYNPIKTTGHARKQSTRISTTDLYGSSTAVSTYDSTERYPTSVLAFNTDKHKRPLHPTQKPVALLEYLIRTYTNADDIVLDNTMGSGSTGVASVASKRRFIGIEKDVSYFTVASERLESDVTY